jgi:hypothetical protein
MFLVDSFSNRPYGFFVSRDTQRRELKMAIVNLTPHTLNIVRQDGTVLDIAPSGKVTRVTTTSVVVGEIDGIEIRKTDFGQVVDLPDADGSVFVVSRLVLQASGRGDLVAPGDLVRDDKGQPVGCKGLSR